MSTIQNFFRIPLLTRQRIRLAYVVALVTDALQIVTGPFGLVGLDQILDVAAMILTTRLLGFHMLLLPTAILEFVPLLGLLPTWTGCVALLISIRKKEQNYSSSTAQLEVRPPR